MSNPLPVQLCGPLLVFAAGFLEELLGRGYRPGTPGWAGFAHAPVRSGARRTCSRDPPARIVRPGAVMQGAPRRCRRTAWALARRGSVYTQVGEDRRLSTAS
jgi:hypothetical protein